MKNKVLHIPHEHAFYVEGEITEAIVRQFAEFLAQYKACSPTQRVSVVLDSVGGCYPAMHTLASMIDNGPCEVWTVGVGSVYSSAAMLFLAGHYRILTPAADFMLHSVRHDGPDGQIPLNPKLKSDKNLLDLQVKFIKDRSELTAKNIKNNLLDFHDQHYSPDQLKGMGLADAVMDVAIY